MRDLFDSSVPSLSTAFADIVRLRHSAVAVATGVGVTTTRYVSGDRVRRLHEVQGRSGEGPVPEALSTRVPVLWWAGERTADWPTFAAAARAEHLGTAAAVPLLLADDVVGAVSMYDDDVRDISGERLRLVVEAAPVLAHAVARDPHADDPEAGERRRLAEDELAFSRVHQATGMVMVQTGLSIEAAALLLRARAFAEDRSVESVARDVVARTTAFRGLATPDDGRPPP